MNALSTLLITDREIQELLPMASCVDVMQRALESVASGNSTLPLRTVIRMDGTPNAFASMPAVHGAGAGAAIGAKVITVFPGNDATPYDSHIGVVLLFDAAHGRLLAILDASSITAIRTAAVSGLATRLLANPDASEVAILGAGVLAMPHLEAMRAVRPVKRVRVWSRSGTRAEQFAQRARILHDVEIIVCGSATAAVDGADIVCTITSSRTPILEGSWISPGTHVNAVGASIPTARELDSAAVQMASLFVDRRESTLAEAGDFLLARAEGAVQSDHIRGEIGELSLGKIPGRSRSDEVTLFKSLGLAVEDVAAAQFVHARAVEAGVGLEVVLGGLRH
jgi:ornithine cyclodeaminase